MQPLVAGVVQAGTHIPGPQRDAHRRTVQRLTIVAACRIDPGMFRRLAPLLLLTVAACTRWVHAPGRALVSQAPRAVLRPVPGRVCGTLALCDREGTHGALTLTLREGMTTLGRLRPRGAFSVDYDGRTMACQHPGPEGEAFRCTGRSDGPHVALDRGCTRGTMVTPQGRYTLQLDTVQTGGQRTPGREAAVLDATGRVAGFVDRSGGGHRVYLAHDDDSPLLPALEMLAVSLGALLDSDATPEGCLTPE